MSALCWGSRGVVGGGGGPPGDATVWPDVATDADLRASDLRTGDRQRTTTPDAEWVYSGTAWEIETLTAATIEAADAVLAANPAIAGARIAITGAEVAYRASAALSLPGGGTRQITVPAEVYDWGSLTVRAYLGGAEDGTARAAQGWTDLALGTGSIVGDEGGTGTTLITASATSSQYAITAAGTPVASTRIYARWNQTPNRTAAGTSLTGFILADDARVSTVGEVNTTDDINGRMQFRAAAAGFSNIAPTQLRSGGVGTFNTQATWEIMDLGRTVLAILVRNGLTWQSVLRDNSIISAGNQTPGRLRALTGSSSGTSTLRLRDVWIITA
jgi:hypothetical protein